MKASLLAVSISSLLCAQAYAAQDKVDIQLANQHTDSLIEAQMFEIDASIQTKLNSLHADAVAGTTATLDDVAYEKQSDGSWVAVGTVSAALLAGLLTTSSSSNDDDNVTPPIPGAETMSMDSVGSWVKVEDSGKYLVRVGDTVVEIQEDSIHDNGDGTITISSKNQSVTLGVNGDEIYWVDQVHRPELDAPEFGGDRPELEAPEFGGDRPELEAPEFGGDRPDLEKPKDNVYLSLNTDGSIRIHQGDGSKTTKFKAEANQDDSGYVIINENGEIVGNATINNNGDFIFENGLRITSDGYIDLSGVERPEIGQPIEDQPRLRDDWLTHEYIITTNPDGSSSLTLPGVHGGEIEITYQSKDDGGYQLISIDGHMTQEGKDKLGERLGHIDRPEIEAPEFGDDRPELPGCNTQGCSYPDSELPEYGNDPSYGNNHYQLADVRDDGAVLIVNGEEVARMEYSDGRLTVNPYASNEQYNVNVRVIDHETNGDRIVYIGDEDSTMGGITVRINEAGVISPIDRDGIQSQFKTIDRNKLQSIDPTKLQKAKSAIQQRLRG